MTDIEQVKTDKFCFYIFKNIFDNNELEYIWKESLFLCDEDKLLPPDKTGSAKSPDGQNKKKNKGIWLDNLYHENTISNYLKIYKKPLKNIGEYKSSDYTLNLFSLTNIDRTLMSYYEDNDYYHGHRDVSCYTYVFWLFKEPKNFLGGDLYFDDVQHKIQINSNTGILFPSWVIHSVDKITMMPGVIPYKGFGRFAFSTFYSYK